LSRLSNGETHHERRNDALEQVGIEKMRIAVIALLESALDRDETMAKIIDAVSELDP